MANSVKKKIKEFVKKRELGEYDKEVLEKLVDEEDDKIVVDWEFFNELERRDYSSLATHVLLELGMLSLNWKNNYALFGCGIIINPSAVFSSTYFTRKEDAEAYKKAAYSGTLYSVSIVKMVE
jgi:hypothetical protein